MLSFIRLSILTLFICSSISIGISNAQTFLFKIPSGSTLNEPRDVAVDSSGNIYVLLGSSVAKLDSAGNEIMRFGSGGGADGQFNDPSGLALDASGNIYVADLRNHRIQKFDSDGTFQSKIGKIGGGSGTGDGEFNFPQDVAVDASGNIYVVESANHRVQIFNSSGVFQRRIGFFGSADGRFIAPEGIALDASGNIYVADTRNDRIQKFNSSGVFQGTFGTEGTGNLEFNNPESIAVDSGSIYVADTGNNRVSKFSAGIGFTIFGSFQGNFGTAGSGKGQFNFPLGVTVDASGNIYVADRDNNRVQKFNSSRVFLDIFGISGNADGRFNSPRAVAFDSSGNIYVADADNHRIQKFDSSGTFIGWLGRCTSGANCNSGTSMGFTCTAATCVLGGSGTGDGQFDEPRAIAIDASGNIYVADRDNDRIQIFDSDGDFEDEFGTSGNGDGEFDSPGGVAVDSSGNIYVADTFNDRIQKFNASGVFQSKFGTFGSGDGEFDLPEGIALDASGNIYVADEDNSRIQKFDSSGTFIGWLGKCTSGANCNSGTSIGFTCTAATCGSVDAGSGDGQFDDPSGLAVDASGNIYVADRDNDRIQIFNSSGMFLLEFGTEGLGNGQFDSPIGVAVDALGNISIADTNNDRVQVFSEPKDCGNMIVEGIEQCDEGTANGAVSCCSSICEIEVIDTECRASAGACDPAELCDGSSSVCPADILEPDTTVCRAAVAGGCDVAEMCTGSSVDCPDDTFAPDTTVCRAAVAGGCDVAEMCPGNSAACPDNVFASSSTVCRATNGGCDVAESCTGSSADCPADVFASASTECRAVDGVCDVAESCTGSSADCPTDVFASASTECRASAGVCDVAESCTGSSADCPTDGFDTGTECRAAADVCDVAESCDGSGPMCPTDGFDTGTECRASVGICDIAESCDGSGAACPTDVFEPATTECRASNGICDVEETCTGSTADCPDDVFADEGTECRASSGLCDIAESCDGSGAACPTDAFEPATTECRASEGICDVAESCDGLGAECPTDEFVDNETVCRVADSSCDLDEFCPGDSSECPEDLFRPENAICEAEVGPDGLCKNNSCVNEGVLTIVKVANPSDGTDFVFGCTDDNTQACEDLGDQNGLFILDDEPGQTDIVEQSITSDLMFVGLYMIEELLPEGWQLDELECVNDEDGESVLDPDNNMVMVDLDPAEDITCTFFNSSVTDTGEFLSVDLDLETITVEPAEMVSMSVDVTNPSSVTSSLALTRQTAEGVMFTVEIPEGFTIEELTTSQGDCNIELLECDLGDIEPGETVTITVDAVVPEGDGVYRVSFIASTSSGQEFSGTATVNVQSEDSGTGVATGGSGGNGGCAVAQGDLQYTDTFSFAAVFMVLMLIAGIRRTRRGNIH